MEALYTIKIDQPSLFSVLKIYHNGGNECVVYGAAVIAGGGGGLEV